MIPMWSLFLYPSRCYAMLGVTDNVCDERRRRPMPKRKPSKPSEQPPAPASTGTTGKQVNFRASEELYARLEALSSGLGLDISNLVRMVLMENLHAYEARLEGLRKRHQQDTGN